MPLYPSPVPTGRRRPAPFVLCPGCPEAVGSLFRAATVVAAASAAWPTADLGFGYPFVLPEPRTALQLYCYNGATVAGTRDVGIYDASGSRIVAAGSTAAGSGGLLQVFDIADTALAADTVYYMWMSASTNTDSFIRWTHGTNVGQLAAIGIVQAASVFPLPASITAAALATGYLPWSGIAFTGTF